MVDSIAKVAQARSKIASMQGMIAQLETVYQNLMLQAAMDPGSYDPEYESFADIQSDFQEYVSARSSLSPEEQMDTVSGLVVRTSGAYESANMTIPAQAQQPVELAKAWVEMSGKSQSPAVVKTAMTNLRAAVGAMRSELRFWEQETKTEQEIRKEMNKLAEI